MDSSATKSKHDRATHEQLEHYVAFCRGHPEIGTGKNSPKAPQQMQDLWKQLADELNACRGPTRTAAKWRETLGVWKSQLRTRARRLKMAQRLTGGGPGVKPMSDFEEKALDTFGMVAVDGVKGIQSLGFVPPCKSLSVECTDSANESSSSLDSPLPSCSTLLLFEPLSPAPLPSPTQPPTPAQPLSPAQLQSSEQSPNSTPTSSFLTNMQNQDFRVPRPTRGERNRLINTLIANMGKRNAAEQERRNIEDIRHQEHREVMQAIQGLTNTMTELIKVLQKTQNNLAE